MMHTGFTGIIVTSSIRPANVISTLILRQGTSYTPPPGSLVILTFSPIPYTPPIAS